jgi:hypothetical protein
MRLALCLTISLACARAWPAAARAEILSVE